MRKIIKYFSILLVTMFVFNLNVFAKESTLYVNLETLKYSTDGKSYKDITVYEELDDFLEDYEDNKLAKIYITNFLFDGVSTVKTPDLDDFIEEGTNETKIKALEIQAFNVNTTGNVEFTGTTVGSMIAVNTNDVTKDINIILNDVNLDTDSKKAPGIYVYNKETTYTDAKVTIKTVNGTKNYITGGKLKKVSLLDKDNLSNYESNYTGDSLTNYTTYSKYYGIYTADEIDNILFATVKADSEDLQDGDPLYFYKGSGAISSDIDLYFEGEGYLEVNSKNKEGIETKGNVTFSGGTGDYAIYAYDDCINTTTASSAGTNVRNDMVIDVNSLLAIVNDEGDEGDAIDSNGKLTINGGKIYAFAHSDSEDSGLDSETGIYLNGGTIIATGNMADSIASDSELTSLYIQFGSKIEKDTLIVIKDEDDEIITAFKTSKDITTLLYASEDLEYDSLKVYTGGTIEGTETNGLYTKIESYEGGSETTFSLARSMNMNFNNNSNGGSNFILIMLLSEVGLLIIVLAITLLTKKKNGNVKED